MKKFLLLALLTPAWSGAWAQRFPLDSLLEAQNFAAVVQYEPKADQLTATQLFQVAYSFMMLDQPAKTVAFCDRAIAKGMKAPVAHFIKGMALRETGELPGALRELEIACQADPKDADYHRELAKTQLQHQQPDRAIQTLRQFIARNPTDYEAQKFALSFYNGLGRYAAADSLFGRLRGAFVAGQLPAAMARPRNVVYHIFQWRGQNVVVSRQYETPTEALKPLYRIMLFDKKQDDVERSMVVELTALAADGDAKAPKYSLAERGLGATLHRSYGRYWNTEAIPPDELQSAVSKVLDDTYDPNVRSGPDKFKTRK